MENTRFRIVFQKLEEAMAGPIEDVEELEDLRILRSEIDEIEELRAIVLETSEPKPSSYTLT